jgi:DNA mismatch repair ATPase MutS
MCYVITKHSRELETRAYDFKIAFGKRTKQVAERLAERMNVDLADENSDDDGGANDDIFSDETTAQTAARFEPVRQLLSDITQSETIADAIADICVEIKEETQGEQDSKKALKQVKQAKRLLWSVNIEKAGADTLVQVRSDLQEIDQVVDELLAQLPTGGESAT